MRIISTLSLAAVNRAWLAYKAGASLAAVAKRHQCAPSTLHRRLKLAGKRLRPVGRPAAVNPTAAKASKARSARARRR